MKLTPEQLDAHLAKGLKPAYLVTGDEPFQHLEALDKIRQQARQSGYQEREVFTVDKNFNWDRWLPATHSLSLFSSQRLLELRLESPKIGTEGSQAIGHYLQQPTPGTLLLIGCSKLEAAAWNNAWLRALDQQGIVIQVWPLQGQALLHWLERRLRSRGFKPEPLVVQALLERVEGNLLAAAQEVDKLALIHPQPGALSLEQLQEAVTDSARYDVFTLTDAVLAGNIPRILHILAGLRAEEVALPVILWALSREIRQLYSLSCQLSRGGVTPAQILERQTPPILAKRKPLLEQVLSRTQTPHWALGLQRCAKLDQVIKGQQPGDGWEVLQLVCLQLADFRKTVKHLSGNS